MIKQKNKHKSEFAKTKSKTEQQLMYNLKDQIKNEIIVNKQEEMSNFLSKLEKTPVSTKPFWQRVNKARKKDSSDAIPTLTKDGVDFKSDEEKANIFAEKLANTFNETNPTDFDNEFKQNVDQIICEKQYEANYQDKQTVLITLLDLTKAIKNLNNSKSTDTTGLSNFIIKKLPINSRLALLNLFNQCLIDSEMPKEWKIES